jgi:hypothetical protein
MDYSRYYWLALVPVIAIGAFFGGRALRPDAVASYGYDLDTPAYKAALATAATSKGGFSGFGAEGTIDGETLVSGRIAAINADTLTIETERGEAIPIRITGAGPLRRIEAASMSALRPGMTVVARTGSDGGEVAALLIIATP